MAVHDMMISTARHVTLALGARTVENWGGNSQMRGGNITSEGGNNNICFCNLEHTRTRIRSYISVVIPNTYTHTHTLC
jgi:hypothetical protein